MDDELRKAVGQRALALWEAAGRPDGHELVYRLRAEKEIGKSPSPVSKTRSSLWTSASRA